MVQEKFSLRIFAFAVNFGISFASRPKSFICLPQAKMTIEITNLEAKISNIKKCKNKSCAQLCVGSRLERLAAATAAAAWTYLEANHDGRCERELPGSLDDPLRDDVTPHDAAEYVHEDGVDLRRRC